MCKTGVTDNLCNVAMLNMTEAFFVDVSICYVQLLGIFVRLNPTETTRYGMPFYFLFEPFDLSVAMQFFV